ncbi:hypothetical protein [Rossellomorea aquimaris]|uniref:Uncharacterized protein n=1 Tax=Rossellomorea aquimaris TaxID=189382 RepID=A0A1J6W3P2_9BACI|nr:hypothetical protein [Rossellomorea aquimaris]OIU71204.1 hypothetical protein BHE18_09185 [Rossellomorea aquimaris]
MGIDYRFNEWRVSGEKAEAWSPMAYRLLSKNATSEHLNGFRIGQMLYLHHIEGMSAKEIKHSPVGFGLNLTVINATLRGYKRKYMSVGVETIEAYDIAMYMIEHEPEVLERMYRVNISKN